MKYLWLLLSLLIIAGPIFAEDFEVTEAQYVVITGQPSDTLGRTMLIPDSIRIVVTDSAQTELHDAWYLPAADQVTLNGDVIAFTDQWEDINGAASVGVFNIMVTIASDAQGNVDVFTNYNYTLKGLANEVVYPAGYTTDFENLYVDPVFGSVVINDTFPDGSGVATEASVQSLSISATNLSSLADSVNLTDGTETNTYTAARALNGLYYEVAEGGTGTNLNISFYLIFDIGASAQPVEVHYVARLDEGSAPSGGDELLTCVYNWNLASWIPLAPSPGNITGIFLSSPSDDIVYSAVISDPDFVGTGANEGLVRIAFSNYDCDGAPTSDLEENTELFMDYVFVEYQTTLAAGDIWEELKADHTTADSYGDYLDDEITSRSSHGPTDIVSSGAITTSGGEVTTVTTTTNLTTNNDKTGYSLVQGFPSNFALMDIDGSGLLRLAPDGLDADTSFTQLQSFTIALSTIMGYTVGEKSELRYYDDVDSTFIVPDESVPGDTSHVLIRFHPGGVPNGWADSVKILEWP